MCSYDLRWKKRLNYFSSEIFSSTQFDIVFLYYKSECEINEVEYLLKKS